jgi:beta-mannosidase
MWHSSNLSAGWKLKQHGDESEHAWLPVETVPTNVYKDLLANKKIADPFKDLNELSVRWVADKAWVYRTEFSSPKQVTGQSVCLVFEGLDTFAKASLNGIEILTSDNMFLSHRVDITRHLKPANVLEIVFDSAKLRGQELLTEHKHEHRFIARQTEDGRIPVRKAQYHWGWDWGPVLVGTSGPWRPVRLETYVARIGDFGARTHVDFESQSCGGTLFAEIEGAKAGDTVTISLSFGDQTVWQTESIVGHECDLERCVVRTDFKISSAKLWYPRGYGNQDRYIVKAILRRGESPTNQLTLDIQHKYVGFRHVQLVQQEDESGKSFYFRINGHDIFAGGSCWIPGSSFLSEIGDRYKDWIKLLAEGNHTMVRVWGGKYTFMHSSL